APTTWRCGWSWRQPPCAGGGLAVLQILVELAQPGGDGAGHAGREGAAVHRPHRRDPAEGAGDEGLVCLERLLDREVLQPQRNPVRPAQVDDIGPGDAVEA